MALSPERAALLKQNTDDYIASMEDQGNCCNYNRLDTDRLLILEALNDWSGRALSEGGEIKLSYACDDPVCATSDEVFELTGRMHAPPVVVLYPVSGFVLSDTDGLQFKRNDSTYRMLPHTSASRTDGIGIAEATHIRDIEAALQLWAFCATEDCLAYLLSQMSEHSLYFEDDEVATSRQIIASALTSHFSVGQIRNTIWRTVRHAAALSTRQYYNTWKASKTIPKKMDSVLAQHADNTSSFEHYARPASRPMGAVLSLMLNRFGIGDNTPGSEVRARLAADAALSSPMPPDEPEFDEGHGLVLGTAYFDKEFTSLDHMILSCFTKIRFDPPEIQWDKDHIVGRLDFSMDTPHCFDGTAFLLKFLEANNVPAPTDADYARHAEAAIELSKDTAQFVDKSGKEGVIHEVLAKAGVPPEDIPSICFTLRYTSDPQNVVRTLALLPGQIGLTAFRIRHTHLYSDCIETSDGLYSPLFSFDFPEVLMEPEGCDTEMIQAINEGDIDRFTDIVTNALLRSVRFYHPELNNLLLSGIGQRLLDRASKNSEGSKPPADEKT